MQIKEVKFQKVVKKTTFFGLWGVKVILVSNKLKLIIDEVKKCELFFLLVYTLVK